MFLHPDFAFRRVFEFPDRRDLFQFVDRPLAGTERLGPVLSPYDNQHDVVADADFAIPVEDRHLDDVKILQRPLADLAELLLRHPFVVLEGDAGNIAPIGAITGCPEKNRNAADALRPTPHPINLRIDGEIFPLHTHELGIVTCKLLCTHDFSQLA